MPVQGRHRGRQTQAQRQTSSSAHARAENPDDTIRQCIRRQLMLRAAGKEQHAQEAVQLDSLLRRPFRFVYLAFLHRHTRKSGTLGPVSIYSPGNAWLLLKWMGQRNSGLDWDSVCRAAGGRAEAPFRLLELAAQMPVQNERALAQHRL
eukprot:1164158-Alexandrium_andersonii.AAC.1